MQSMGQTPCTDVTENTPLITGEKVPCSELLTQTYTAVPLWPQSSRRLSLWKPQFLAKPTTILGFPIHTVGSLLAPGDRHTGKAEY